MSILSILGAIVGVVGQLAAPVTRSVSRHVCFLIHYKKNLKKLDAEMKDLEKQMGKFQEKVEAANHLGEDMEKDASDWLTDAEKMKEEVLEFLKNETAKENLQCCCKFSFPDCIWRYRLSKEANKKLGNVKNLNEKGKFSPVSHPRPPPEELQLQSSGDYMSFESRERVFERIMEALKDSKVNMIGVYGPGGVGKTTMVEKVAKQAKLDGVFDEVVMAVVSTEPSVSKIQGQLADRLNVTLRGETELGRADQLWNRLNNEKKNLIILDDIWKEVNLKEIGIPITDENKGCKVVLTSRNRDVWKNMQAQRRDLPIEILSELEAWALFKKKAGDSVDSDHELRPIAKAVCRECKGLPVAINAVGAALKGRELYAWKDALKKMEKSMLNKIEGIDPNLYTSLTLSYNLLQSDDAKSIFLLCCLFPEDFNISIESLMRHCMARRLLGENPDTLEEARLAVHTVVGTLKISCLLLEGDDDVEHFVKMHDVVRDVAISILKSDGGEAFLAEDGVQEWPEKCSCEGYSAILLLNSNINYELPDELKCPKLHTLLFQPQYPHELLKVPDKFFSRMEKLTVLDFSYVNNLLSITSLANLVNLRMLCLHNCNLGDIAILEHLKNNLEILSLRNSDIKALPVEIGQLTRLRLLDLEDCPYLKVIPQGVISNLIHLEELYMLHSFDQWEAPTDNKERSNVSLGELKSLIHLNTLQIHIPDVMLLPKDDHLFDNLSNFIISAGQRLPYNKSSTRMLKLVDGPLKQEFNVLLLQAEVLYLENMKGLKNVLHDRGAGQGFLNLKYLDIENCDDLEHLLGKPKLFRPSNEMYASRGSFNKLTKLIVLNCTGLKYLFSPSCARGLLQLQQLEVGNCEIMKEIIGIEGGKHDEELTLNKVIINFGQLKYMKLENLPNLISFYPKMKKMAATEGSSSTDETLQPLFNEKVVFPALKELTIRKLHNITAVCDKQFLPIPEKETESFHQLVDVTVKDCEKLMNLFPSNMVQRLQKMKTIFLSDCETMEVIFSENSKDQDEAKNDDIIAFPQLEVLSLINLQNFVSFCSSSTLSSSESQPTLFNHQIAFPSLSKLRISEVPNIREIWDKKLLSAETLCQLKHVTIMKCYKLTNLFSSSVLSRLHNLEELIVEDCPEMEVIVHLVKGEGEVANDNIIMLPQLTLLRLHCLEKLRSFCATKSEGQPFFNHQVAFPKLEYLFLLGLRQMHFSLAPSGESSLRYLQVQHCDQESIVVSSHMLQGLQKIDSLVVKNCGGVREVFQFEGLDVGEIGQQYVRPLTEVIGMKLYGLPQLTCLWSKDPLGILSFQTLELVTVKRCPLLRNLFTSSIAMALPRLKKLCLMSCELMEEVVIATTRSQGHKAEDINIVDEVIVFPNLEMLTLTNLSSLTSFCSANYTFSLPSLKRVVLKRCPKMQTFTFGQIHMPPIRLITRGDKEDFLKDNLNEYLKQQRLLKGKEREADDDEEAYDDEEAELPWWWRLYT